MIMEDHSDEGKNRNYDAQEDDYALITLDAFSQ